MGKVLEFKSKKEKWVEKEAQLLMRISDELDAVIIRHLQRGEVEPHELAGLVSHRLGNLLKIIEDKNALWEVCERVLKKQAGMNNDK